MLTMSSILCSTDLSVGSNRALPMAAALAKAFGAKLTVLHVSQWGFRTLSSVMLADLPKEMTEDRERALPVVTEILDQAAPVDWELVVKAGPPADEIRLLAEHIGAGMVVAATHNQSGLDRLLLGSVTRKLLHHLKTPLLVMPADSLTAAPDPGRPIKSVLIATDLSDNAAKAANFGFAFAAALGAETHLLSVLDGGRLDELPGRTDLTAMTEKLVKLEGNLKKLAGDAGAEGVKVATALGRAYDEIDKYALKNQVDIVVMGLQGRGAFGNLLVGSTVDRVIRRGHVPVVAVRG